MQMAVHQKARRSKAGMLRDVGPGVERSRLVARNTLEYTAHGRDVVRLHKTDIVQRVHASGSGMVKAPPGAVVICTGGFNTKTTRARINEALRTWAPGYSVHTHRARLWLSTPEGESGPIPFLRTCVIGPRGSTRPDMTPAQIDAEHKRLDAFVKAWDAADLDSLRANAAGDPWVTPHPESGLYVRPYALGWIRERYVFWAFLVAAMRFAGYRGYDSVGMIPGDPAWRRRMVRRYARACLGWASS